MQSEKMVAFKMPACTSDTMEHMRSCCRLVAAMMPLELDDAFRTWRFRHVTTLERIIGFIRGADGTSGARHLRKMLDGVPAPLLCHFWNAL